MKTLPHPTHRQSTKRPVPVDRRHAPTTLFSLSARREPILPAGTRTSSSELRRPQAISNWPARGPSPSAKGPIRATRDVGLRPWPGRPQSFLRKMVIGNRNDPSTRLLDDSVVQTFGVDFDRLRRISTERRTIEIHESVPGGMVQLNKLNEETRRSEATVSLPIAPHELKIAVECERAFVVASEQGVLGCKLCSTRPISRRATASSC